ncbi:hypothetical protein O181_042238 [Austropuccinia psidii MF-1]|uniref:Uncharacterized protein n=1 Tax=Austropuccinia psidii MF-1 TaxID=1389203 RepID=A0A9Q3HEK7_9BASI|nr:hypothetical protein [Austropuccinia psidii MF-1]
MDNMSFDLEHWEELGAGFQKICLKDIPFKDLMVITKGCNSSRKFKLLEDREAGIIENQATIQGIEEQLNWKEHSIIPSGSQGVNRPEFSVASHYPGTRR